MFLGVGLVNEGDGESGSAQFLRGFHRFHATGARLASRFFAAVLADVHERRGDTDQALDALRLAMGADDESAFWDSELHRMEGDIAARSHAPEAEIEACYRQALSISRVQGQRSLELRAATSMARFRWTQGERDEAVGILAPVCEWFAGGPDSPDTLEAKNVLSDISRHPG